MMNIEKYLNNTNGVYYKNEDAFNNHDGVCYIGINGLSELRFFLEDGKDLTDEEIIENCIGSSYDTIIDDCYPYFNELNEVLGEDFEDFDINHCAEVVFHLAEGTYIPTKIQEIINFA